MKQFEWARNDGPRAGEKRGPYTLGECDFWLYPGEHDILDGLPIGAEHESCDGDVWKRLPDLLEVASGMPIDPAMELLAQRDERLERIATAALQGLLSGCESGVYPGYDTIAQVAVEHAKALIAKLDKQS